MLIFFYFNLIKKKGKSRVLPRAFAASQVEFEKKSRRVKSERRIWNRQERRFNETNIRSPE